MADKDGIMTTHRGKLIVAYDRISPRHNWRLLVSDVPEGYARVHGVTENWRESVAGYDKYPEYQQIIVELNIGDGGLVPDNLPKNQDWSALGEIIEEYIYDDHKILQNP